MDAELRQILSRFEDNFVEVRRGIDRIEKRMDRYFELIYSEIVGINARLEAVERGPGPNRSESN
ncbi:MAG: hypothetical protein WEE89_10125 [Gemmatimonadota bacterium]